MWMISLALKDKNSLDLSLKIINEFCNHAGSKININKTECILLGGLKDMYDEINGIKATHKAVRCLGIYIGHDKEECYNKNWMKIYHDMEKLFESWKRRKLTVFGKSCMIKTLATSKLVYIASILCIPDKEYICKVQRLLFNFIWDKSERIKRNTLIGDITDGGLSIIDIESKFKALKAAWIPRLLSSKGTLFEILGSFLEKANLNLHYVLQFSETNLNALDRIGKLPLFYKQILSSFNECKQRCNFDNISPNDILKQPIWNNNNIKIKGETLFFKNWVNSNILYLKDLIDDNGNIKTLQVLSTIIKRKSNWLCEYKTLLSVIKPLCKKYNFTNVKYLNIKNEVKFYFATGVSCSNFKKMPILL